MPLARRSAALLAGTLAVAGLTLPGAPAAYAVETSCDQIRPDTTDADDVTAPSAPFEELGVQRAWELLDARGRRPGEGVGVAVVDSGIADVRGLPEVGGARIAGHARSADDAHFLGTAVAGLIAGQEREGRGGPVGIAPYAGLYDVKVYDTPVDSDDGRYSGLTADGVVAGLQWVVAHVDSTPRIRIATVPSAVRPSKALERVVARLDALGVAVVAAAGNRPSAEGDPVLGDFVQPRQGEDAAGVVFPAGYDAVVAATSSAPRGVDPRDLVVPSSAADVAVPTVDGVSYGVNGVTCLLLPENASTSWAAAEVSGILALLMSAYPRETTDQVVQRLYRTATGVGDLTTRLTGHGIAQPVEALQRPLAFDRRGDPERSETSNTTLQAEAPRAEADVLEETRRDAVWWGLAGGGALVVALLLRPVLARRRER